jgi:hypothetical protein
MQETGQKEPQKIKKMPHRFKKGQSGNPSGRVKIPDYLRKVRPFTNDEIRRTIAQIGRMTLNECREIRENKDSSAMRATIASCYIDAWEKGDIYKLEMMFCRTIGRPETKPVGENPEPLIIQRANGEQVLLTSAKNIEDDEVLDAEEVQ